MHNTLYTFLQP